MTLLRASLSRLTRRPGFVRGMCGHASSRSRCCDVAESEQAWRRHRGSSLIARNGQRRMQRYLVTLRVGIPFSYPCILLEYLKTEIFGTAPCANRVQFCSPNLVVTRKHVHTQNITSHPPNSALSVGTLYLTTPCVPFCSYMRTWPGSGLVLRRCVISHWRFNLNSSCATRS